MSSQLLQLLNQWFPQRDAIPWVLGTVYKTQGHCYRKAGAMMLFNGLGQKMGLLSGGCLESDLQQHARRLMQSGGSICLSYDASDEDDLAFRLGIGCGGKVYIVLQAIHADNHYLYLPEVRQSLLHKRETYYLQHIPEEGALSSQSSQSAYLERAHLDRRALNSEQLCSVESLQAVMPDSPVVDVLANVLNPSDQFEFPSAHIGIYRSKLLESKRGCCLLSCLSPPVHLLIVGGGADAMPVASIAAQLGWHVTVADHRPANARAEFFPQAMVLRSTEGELIDYVEEQHVDAAILMSHSVSIDARALSLLQQYKGLHYLALLGPASRRKDVLDKAGLTEENLAVPVSGPAGFDLASNSPESIALSILSECHAQLYQGSGQAMSV